MPYHQLYYHLVWGTKNRENLLTPEIEYVVHNLARSKAEGLGGDVFALDGAQDHVHMVASIPPKIAVAKFIGQVKGSSSAIFNKTGLSDIGFFWQDEYGAFTFDKKSLTNHVAYVQAQKRHHRRDGKIIPVLERTEERKAKISEATEVRENEAPYLMEDPVWRQDLLGYDLD